MEHSVQQLFLWNVRDELVKFYSESAESDHAVSISEEIIIITFSKG